MYLSINKKQFENMKKSAFAEAQDLSGEGEKTDFLAFGKSCTLDIQEMCIDKESEELNVSGNIVYMGDELGYVSFEVPLVTDTLADILGLSIKKMNRLKTVLEAVD